MKTASLGFGVAGLVALVASAGIATWAGMPLLALLFEGLPSSQLFLDILAIALLAVALVGLLRLKRRRGSSRSTFLGVVGWLAPLLGLLKTVLDELTVRQAADAGHVTRFFVVAPGVAQGILPLGLGLIVGALAMLLNGTITAKAA